MPPGSAGKGQTDEEGRGESRDGNVELGPHQDRGLAGEHVADDSAEAAGQHAHGEGRQRRQAEGERLGRAIGRESGEPGRVEPEQCPGRPEPLREQPDERGRAEADQKGDIVVHPEDRRADQQIAHGAAADPGHNGEEDEGDEGLPLLRRKHRPRRREHRDARQVEQVEDRAERGGEMGGGHGAALAQSRHPGEGRDLVTRGRG